MNEYRHVNFGNDITFHVYAWLFKSGQVNVNAMVRQAFHRAAEEPVDILELQPLETVQLIFRTSRR